MIVNDASSDVVAVDVVAVDVVAVVVAVVVFLNQPKEHLISDC